MSWSYNLPPLDRTFIRQSAGQTILFERRNNEDFWISTFFAIIDHATCYAKHTATVRRYRQLQRLWKFGGKYLFRARILAALET